MILFCNRCHRRVEVPKWIRAGNIKGKVKIRCPHCKKGEVEFQGDNIFVEEDEDGKTDSDTI